MNPRILEAAEKYAKETFPEFDKIVEKMIGHEAFLAGARFGIEMAIDMASKEFDGLDSADDVIELLRALLTDSQTGEGERG